MPPETSLPAQSSDDTIHGDQPIRLPADALALLVLSAVAMGASPVFVRLAEMGPFASAFWRLALALPALWLWAHLEGDETLTLRPGAALGPVLLAGIAFAGDLMFWHLAILNTSVANATFFATTSPIWVFLFGYLFLRMRIGAASIGGLTLCLLGGGFMIGETVALVPGRLAGDLAGIVTAVFFAIYMLAVSTARARGLAAGKATLLLTAIAAGLLLAVALASGERLTPPAASGWMALVALALVSQVAGQGLVAIALGRLPANFSSLVIFLEAIAAAAFGWVWLGEALGAAQYMGGALIFAGIWLARPRYPAKS